MQSLDQLLKDESGTDPSLTIRKAFAPYTELLEVEGCLEEACVVLLCLSHKRSEAHNLLDKGLARRTIMDKLHLQACADEVQWLHTHNLKYPDIRVSGQRLLAASVKPAINSLSSADCVQRLGWSHNSASVNKAKLFGTFFYYQGKPTCLAQLIAEDDQSWKQVLMSLGLKSQEWTVFKDKFSSELPCSDFPDEVSPYSKQLTFTFKGQDVSLTPVVSNALICDLQRLSRERVGRYTTITHTRPSSVGDLASSLGGRVTVLYYPPSSKHRSLSALHTSNLRSLGSRAAIFNHPALKQSSFTEVCNQLIHSAQQQTRKAEKKLRKESLKGLQDALIEWMAPVVEWRDFVKANPQAGLPAIDLKEPLEYRLAHCPEEQLNELLTETNQHLHLALQKEASTARFAYHDQLLQPLSSQLKKLFKRLGEVEQVEDMEGGRSYLHLTGLRAFDARALSSPYLVGLPSMTAVWGLVQRLGINLSQLLDDEVKIDSVAWYVQQYALTSSGKVPEASIPTKDNGLKKPGLVDDRHCDLVMDMVICYRSEIPLAEKADLIQAALPSRFAGGTLQPPPLYERREWCRVTNDKQVLFSQLNQLPTSGYWVFPHKLEESGLKENLKWLKMNPSVKLVASGYQLLEVPRCREGANQPLHAYAEPLMGLAKLEHPMKVRFQGAKFFYAKAFWRMKTEDLTMMVSKA